ncbi:unnamed protein product, partial [Ectocarpus sp. 4 AP-2014]
QGHILLEFATKFLEQTPPLSPSLDFLHDHEVRVGEVRGLQVLQTPQAFLEAFCHLVQPAIHPLEPNPHLICQFAQPFCHFVQPSCHLAESTLCLVCHPSQSSLQSQLGVVEAPRHSSGEIV